MFNKVINNLNSHPSSFSQFNFYVNRLKKEKSIRTIGIVFIILSMLVQIFATMIPTERSLAASANDIIAGGVSTKAQLTSICRSNAQIRAIYARFDISCDHIASGTTTETTINSSAYNFWSIGRTPLSSNGISSDDWGEVRLTAGGVNVYQRPLKAWGNVSYKAFNIKANGKNYWIIKDCGNLVTIGPYSRVPDLQVRKELVSSPQVKPGDTVHFRIYYRNPVDESVAVDFRLRDLLDSRLQLVGMDGRNAYIDSDPVQNLKGLGGSNEFRTINLVARVKDNTPNGQICNVARVSADVVGVKDSNKVCVTVVRPVTPTVIATTPTPTPPNPTPKAMCLVPGKTNLPADSPECKTDIAEGICLLTTSFIDNQNKDFKVITKASVEGNTKVAKYTYSVDGNSSLSREANTSSLENEQIYKGLAKGDHKIQASVLFTNGNQSVSKTCVAEVTVAEDAQVSLSKMVSRDGTDINGKQVNTGDTLVFKLTTNNISTSTYKNYSGSDYFGDVLDYADIVDPGELTRQGMTLTADKYIKWTVANINGKEKDIKTITVKVKPITPSTNRPSNISSEYDCVISNKYGNQVTMSIKCPLVKSVESLNGKMPDTGPGTTAAIGFVVTVFAGYFLARARLLAKESDIIRRIYQQTAGGV